MPENGRQDLIQCLKVNPICHLLALLGAHHILQISRIRLKAISILIQKCFYIMRVIVRFGGSVNINFTVYALKPLTY